MSFRLTARSPGWRMALLLGIWGSALAYAFLGPTGDKVLESAAIVALAAHTLAWDAPGRRVRLPLALHLGIPLGLLILAGARAPNWIALPPWLQMVDGFWVVAALATYGVSLLARVRLRPLK
ncbi:hypothetical protein [Thermoflexus hugenholtzii]|jgi:hypothetical protein|uniref:Uncharacterized protein n=1 Tax=Thermoflexus hugenholtzii JAD2 TaxID=877466 RepID=A0A212RR62_9CHLR|nr:hypothetical protein [Thermoflexus hugenholtzii]SNB75082.1 hypothetical protein SAMN02746019_00018540 [Thermoflexus hugenholtzii JAD2]